MAGRELVVVGRRHRLQSYRSRRKLSSRRGGWQCPDLMVADGACRTVVRRGSGRTHHQSGHCPAGVSPARIPVSSSRVASLDERFRRAGRTAGSGTPRHKADPAALKASHDCRAIAGRADFKIFGNETDSDRGRGFSRHRSLKTSRCTGKLEAVTGAGARMVTCGCCGCDDPEMSVGAVRVHAKL